MNTFIEIIGDISIIPSIIVTVVLGFYTSYAFLMHRQTKMLNKGFHTDSSKFLQYLATSHFLATIALLVFAIFATIL